MADCGASGTTLDRTARALLSNHDAAKQVASVVGHALATSNPHQQHPRPLTTPQQITLPTVQQQPIETNHPVVSMANSVVHHQQTPQQQPLWHSEQQHHHGLQPQAFLLSPHQQQMVMMQQQQQMQFMIQQQQERLNKQKQQSSVQKETTNPGHEGLVQGATIEDLATAWAEAEAELQTVEATTDLASSLWQEEEVTYEFIHKASTAETTETKNWMQEGMREFHAGNLPEAIRAFEMELQMNNGDNADAWRMLGKCHAENDMDQQAILCLEQAVDRDPYSPEALLALGVSYVNELNHDRAIENLKAWITHNPTFAGLELDDENDVYGVSGGEESAFDDVQRLLLKALEFAPSDASDVLETLGVVYNVSRDYTAAADAFRRAIDLRPDDYQLWNKLGATLANGSKSEEALPAYHKALELKPKYARAWLNMAISHSNMQDYHEASRCYLQTLSLNPSAVHCWSYLRISLSCMERWDLIPLITQQDLNAFKEHFDFILY